MACCCAVGFAPARQHRLRTPRLRSTRALRASCGRGGGPEGLSWCHHSTPPNRPHRIGGWSYAVFAACSARFNAQRFFVAATIALLPAAESFRFGFETASGAGLSAAFLAAHLFRCASAIAFLPAALIVRRFCCGGSGAAAVSAEAPVCIARSSAIWVSRCRFCSSNPRIAAAIISLVSFGVGISAFPR